MNAVLRELPETLRWRSRDVRYYAGGWDEILSILPSFETVPFRTEPTEPPNPFLVTVSRKPLSAAGRPVAVGVVSHRYALIQHRDAATLCRKGIVDAGVDAADLCYEVGVSALGEWMNLRIYLPDGYGLRDSQGEKVALRLECFNAVDGSSRLVVLFGWYRFVCANGMVVGESKIEIRERHEQRLEIESIPEGIASSLDAAQADRRRLEDWQEAPVDIENLAPWIDGPVTKRWGKRAAARVLHICRLGYDVAIDNFAPGPASEKPVRLRGRVAGSPSQARSKYDVAQALSYVATDRNNADDRLGRQAGIPSLIRSLPGRPA